MNIRAPRRPLCLWARWARGAGLAGCLWQAGQAAEACDARHPPHGLAGRSAEIAFSNRTGAGRHEFWAKRGAELRLFAGYAVATQEYNHGVLGGLQDAKVLTIHLHQPGDDRITCPAEVSLPRGHVFEDVRPHLYDVTRDGRPEVIAVHSSLDAGARLEIYDRSAQLLAATPPIGRRNRWLAVIGAGDFDGDGHVEVAYIDRPHLAKTLRIWRYEAGRLTEVTSETDLTNHRIGEDFITSGLRDCGQGPEIVTVDASWQRLVATRLIQDQTETRDIGAFTGPESLEAAMDCR